ncbi:MAG: Holliday junction resolvase RuvX [Candidatus Moraniibacteriota bacterium]|nr:MAG: Holliday junction resolvase RuvX [Candidatus Moranbacteria bacterium]
MLLGIDWGKKKIGLAIAHEDMAIATAYDTIENTRDVFDIIKEVVREHEVHTIVVGRSEHSGHHDNVEVINQFAQKCQALCGVPVVFAQEMFSTREAQSNLIAAGKKGISQKDDAESARIILQQYLDAQKEVL